MAPAFLPRVRSLQAVGEFRRADTRLGKHSPKQTGPDPLASMDRHWNQMAVRMFVDSMASAPRHTGKSGLFQNSGESRAGDVTRQLGYAAISNVATVTGPVSFGMGIPSSLSAPMYD